MSALRIVDRGILIRIDSKVVDVGYSKLLNWCEGVFDLMGEDLEVFVPHADMQMIKEHRKVVPVRMLLQASDKG